MVSKHDEAFGIPGKVTFVEGPGGFELVEVRNEQGSATIALQGAQVLTWAPEGEKPVVWLSKDAKYVKGKSARGGIPICWPWFGPHATESAYPSHGFARNMDWETVETGSVQGATKLVFRLIPGEDSWPYASELECRIEIGRTLKMDLVTRNTGSAPFTIGCALHTYFGVSDVRQVRILGLEDRHYLDKANGGKRRQEGPITIASEVDRIYLDTTSDCLLVDPGFDRVIRIEKIGSRSTVVWNPWMEKAEKMGDLGRAGYLDMLCVESCNAAEDVVTVFPGGEHRLGVKYSIEEFQAISDGHRLWR